MEYLIYLKYLIEKNDINNSYNYFHFLLIVKISSDIIVAIPSARKK